MLAATDNLTGAAFLVIIGIFFDFFDGFAARLLNVQSELGVQLDSLADMVTSGVVPGIVMFQLIRRSLGDWTEFELFGISNTQIANLDFQNIQFLPFLGLLLALGACYRLANFNIDTRQTESFIGLPTPAMTLFVISLPLIHEYSEYTQVIDFINNKWFLLITSIMLVILMNAELPLFSLKLKNFSFKNNLLEVLFLLLSIVLLIVFKFISIPLIIVVYVLISLFKK